MKPSNDETTDDQALPRMGSVMHAFHFQDKQQRERKLKSWQKLNKYLMIPLYRADILPLFGIGKYILLLTTIERKDGKKRRTPLEYRKQGDSFLIFSSMGEKSAWVKNIRASPDKVAIKRGFRKFVPKISFISEKQDKIEILKWYVVNFGKSAEMLFGWNPKTDDPNNTDFSKLEDLLSIIRLDKQYGENVDDS
ncbi:MAG: nitroreductase family deazaflavin-dependent oxidoreductase [Candidatus Lokiarchaeota archaeon]|nr:nitroreductase family deazaflavin-dependent oxidoreductase [Candidatus Lokiarchaeota archaeon]